MTTKAIVGLAEHTAKLEHTLVELTSVCMLLSAPYTCPHELCRTATRYQHARWTAGGTAVVWERWYKVRTTIISKVAPGGAMEQLMTYDFSDGYNHPGTPLLEEGPYGRSVLRIHDDDALLWEGGGGSPDGARPFLDVRGFADGVIGDENPLQQSLAVNRWNPFEFLVQLEPDVSVHFSFS